MWSKITSALKPRDGHDSDPDHSDAQSTTSRSPPDPFRANATTYYTYPTPPTPPPGAHSRTASREEDIIWSLRTQLALQQELCAQFEIDLGARDELVEALTHRLEASEKENEKRKSVVRSWKKKAADLEKMCRHLEEEVDNSRQESMERSIMDEASGEALRQLHRQIAQLERERNDLEAERNSLAQTVENSQNQLHSCILQLQQEKGEVETERDNLSSEVSQLRTHIQQLQKESAIMEVTIVQLNKQLDQDKEDIGGLNIALESKQQELELVKRKHGARGTMGLTAGRTNAASSTVAKPVGNAGSAPLRVAPALGNVTKPPVSSALRRASSSTVVSKTKLPGRRHSVTSAPSADEKENASTPVPLKHPRRTMVPA